MKFDKQAKRDAVDALWRVIRMYRDDIDAGAAAMRARLAEYTPELRREIVEMLAERARMTEHADEWRARLERWSQAHRLVGELRGVLRAIECDDRDVLTSGQLEGIAAGLAAVEELGGYRGEASPIPGAITDALDGDPENLLVAFLVNDMRDRGATETDAEIAVGVRPGHVRQMRRRGKI